MRNLTSAVLTSVAHLASDTPLEWMYRMRSPGRMTVRA